MFSDVHVSVLVYNAHAILSVVPSNDITDFRPDLPSATASPCCAARPLKGHAPCPARPQQASSLSSPIARDTRHASNNHLHSSQLHLRSIPPIPRLLCRFRNASRASRPSGKVAHQPSRATRAPRTSDSRSHTPTPVTREQILSSVLNISRSLKETSFAIPGYGSRTPRVGAARECTWVWCGPGPVATTGCFVWVCLLSFSLSQ